MARIYRCGAKDRQAVLERFGQKFVFWVGLGAVVVFVVARGFGTSDSYAEERQS
jgi:hypothetical protein